MAAAKHFRIKTKDAVGIGKRLKSAPLIASRTGLGITLNDNRL